MAFTPGPPVRKASTSFINHASSWGVEALLKLPSGWLIYNTHGLNGEGWGPMSSDFLDRLLNRLVPIDSVAVLPTGKVLAAVQ